jgi:hypothetical protein
MADEGPNLDVPESAEKESFPWIPIVVIIAVIAAAAMWILHGKASRVGHDTTVDALEQQLTADEAVLDEERNKVVDMTNQLEAMKQAITFGQVKDRKKAADDYNKLAAEQNAQRDKVKTLAQHYNEKVAKLRELQ